MSTLALLSLLVPALQPSLAQPMGPWLDEALPLASDAPVRVAGACAQGYLSGGIQLKPAPQLYDIWFEDRVWGRPEAIEVITRTAEEMAWLLPGADPIIVGDISTRYGGELKGHLTHRSGIDLDISVYWLGGMTYKGDYPKASPMNLDLEANWLLIKSLMDTGLVERILLDQRNIDRIKQYAIDSGSLDPKEAERMFPNPKSRDRFKTGVVHHARDHQEHLHIRVLCRMGS